MPAIIAPQEETATIALRQNADAARARALVGGQDFAVHEEHGRLVYQDEHGLIDLPPPRLRGRHQHVNAASAIAAIRAVFGPQFPVGAIEKGLQGVEWPARLQRLTGKLLAHVPKDAELWLDGGHNEDGARALAAALAEMEEKSAKPLVVLVGLMARKDADAILEPFRGLAQEFYALDIPESTVARKAGDLAEIGRTLGLPFAVAGSVVESLRFIAARGWPRPPRILIMGSLYLAGEVLKLDGSLPK